MPAVVADDTGNDGVHAIEANTVPSEGEFDSTWHSPRTRLHCVNRLQWRDPAGFDMLEVCLRYGWRRPSRQTLATMRRVT
jgi:hypothetical protein